MSDIATRQAIIGGDNDVWGPFEQAANHLAIGANTRKLYLDGSDLKISEGMIGLYNGSQYYNISNSAARIISIAALTVSLWAKIELSVVAGVVTTDISSIGGENDPSVLPTSFTGSYDAAKGGYYETGTKRIVGLVWINAAGAVEGIVNTIGGGDSFAGYSTSDDTLDILYAWERQAGYDFEAFAPGDTRVLQVSTTGNLPNGTTMVLATAGANGIRLRLPDPTLNRGHQIEVSHVDTGDGAVTVYPYAAENMSGLSYIFLTEPYQRIKLICDGTNWQILGGVLYWITGSRNTNDETNREFGMELITYDTKVGTILIGDRVTETETGNTFIVIADSGTVLTTIKATGTGFVTNNNHLTFSISGATALVNNPATDKNADTNMVHASGRNASRFEIELWMCAATTFSWTNAVRIGKAVYEQSAGTNSTGWEAIQIDTNNIKIQTGETSVPFLGENGVVTRLTASDYTYNVILKLVF